jgi:iron complex transport system permease protein
LAALAFAGAAFLCPLVGAFPISAADLWNTISDPGQDTPAARVLGASRLPRVAFALVAGAALSLAGAVMQTLLRNPLAEPFTLGLSGGATLAALLAIQVAGGVGMAGLPWLGPLLPLVSLGGALGALFLVLMLARASRRGPGASASPAMMAPDTLILCGVVINTLTGAAIVLIQYLSNPFESVALLRWIMGGVDVATYGPSWLVLAGLALAGTYMLARSRVLDVLRLGDSPAHHLGVAVGRERFRLLLAAALLTAVVVAYAGPIAFVGLIVPHIVRLLAGTSQHRFVLPAAALAGGGFLAWADAASRTILAPAELPVGILTALVGGPFFLGLLIWRKS